MVASETLLNAQIGDLNVGEVGFLIRKSKNRSTGLASQCAVRPDFSLSEFKAQYLVQLIH